MTYVGQQPSSTFDSGIQDRFTGLSSNTVTLTHDISAETDILVVWNNIVQDSGTYSVGGTGNKTLTLGGTLVSADVVTVYYLNKVMQSVNPTAGSVNTDQLATNAVTNVKMADDAIGVAELSATGTASSSTFLRGDNAWAAAGGDNTPAFMATLSADATISDDTSTKIQCNTEVFDTDSAYDNSTNYRFTPGVAGKYFVFGYVQINGSSGALNQTVVTIRKNGSAIHQSESNFVSDVNSRMGKECVGIVDMDADDYVELYATGNITSGSVTVKTDSGIKTRFGAFKVIT